MIKRLHFFHTYFCGFFLYVKPHANFYTNLKKNSVFHHFKFGKQMLQYQLSSPGCKSQGKKIKYSSVMAGILTAKAQETVAYT